MTSQFSPFVIGALVDLITGGGGNDQTPPIGIYRSGPKLEQFFLDCGLDMRVGSLSRVPATRECVGATSNRPDGDICLKRLIEKVCDPREYMAEPDKAHAVREHLNKALAADGFAVVVLEGRAILVERQAAGVIVEPFARKVELLMIPSR